MAQSKDIFRRHKFWQKNESIAVVLGSQGPVESRVTNPDRVHFAPSKAGDKCKRV